MARSSNPKATSSRKAPEPLDIELATAKPKKEEMKDESHNTIETLDISAATLLEDDSMIPGNASAMSYKEPPFAVVLSDLGIIPAEMVPNFCPPTPHYPSKAKKAKAAPPTSSPSKSKEMDEEVATIAITVEDPEQRQASVCEASTVVVESPRLRHTYLLYMSGGAFIMMCAVAAVIVGLYLMNL